jgi:membrane-anchored protein YejM (alkaline phosphatase superfamily)
MNTVKDSWDDEESGSDADADKVIHLVELQKLETRKKEEEADHAVTEDLFAPSKQTKHVVAVEQQTTKHLTPKTKTRELVSKKEDNERKIKEKVQVKKQVAASKQKHESVFGDAELDLLQDEYCDYEDRY